MIETGRAIRASEVRPKSFPIELTVEALLIYFLALLLILILFSQIKSFFYVFFAYVALFMFLTIFMCALCYILYNISKIIYDVIIP